MFYSEDTFPYIEQINKLLAHFWLLWKLLRGFALTHSVGICPHTRFLAKLSLIAELDQHDLLEVV